MKREAIQTEKAPAAIGPYSQAVFMNGTLYCSGQIPVDPATGDIVSEDITKQTQQVMENLRSVLNEAGGDFSNVAKMQIFLKDMNDFAAVNEVYGSFLEQPFPARACVEVARLPKDVRVEIDAIAQF